MRIPEKKVLIVSYYFPPSGGSGVQRVLKFVKYLRMFGWEPVILTARDADYPIRDDSFFEEIPEGVKVYRSRILEPYRLYRRFTGRRSDESTDIATLSLDKNSRARVSERVAEFVRSTFFVPDARIGWLRFAARLGKEVISRERIDVILSSAPPYTTHLIGRNLQRATGLPWVADFRDSWIGWVSAPQWRPGLSRRLEQKMEASVLSEADKILSVSRGVKEDLLSRNPQFDDHRWAMVSNGYDAEDFKGVAPVHKNEKLTITYTGSLYGPRNPEHMVRALESLQKSRPEMLQSLHFRIVGRVGDPIRKRIESASVGHLFELIPYLTHHESIAYLLGGDVSWLIIDDAPANRGILTGKLYEYIGAGKPILAMAPEGEAATLIAEHNLGVVVPPHDAVAIERTLVQLVETYQARGLVQSKLQSREQFERKYQTSELARILDDLMRS